MASSSASSSFGTLVSDMTLGSQALPHGLFADWAYDPRLVVGNSPGKYGFSQTIGWGTIYEAATGNAATNTRVEVKDLQLWVLSKSTGQWTLLQTSTNGVAGALYVENFAGDASKTAATRVESDGGTSAKPGGGYDWHFWSNNVATAIDAKDVGGVIMSYAARLVVDDPTKADDRASAQYVGAAGADYWNATFTANGDAGIGRFKTLGNDYQIFTMSTLSADGLIANKPTAYLAQFAPKVVQRSGITGQAYAAAADTYDWTGRMIQSVLYAADGAVYDTVTYEAAGSKTIAHHTGLAGLPYTAYDETVSASGQTVSQTFYKADGSVYDQVDLVTTKTGIVTTHSGVVGKGYSQYAEYRDLGGTLLKTVYTNNDGTVREANADGTSVVHRSGTGLPFAKWDDYADAKGVLTKQVFMKADGSLINTATYSATDTGTLVHVTAVAGSAYSAYDRYLDKAGTLAKTVYFNNDGSVREANADGSTILHRNAAAGLSFAKWDDYTDAKGVLTKQVFLKADGSVINTATYTQTDSGSLVHVTAVAGSAYSAYDKVLDQAGTLTKTVYFNNDGSVREANADGSTILHRNAAAGLSFAKWDDYTDAKGVLTKQVFLKADGSVINTANYSQTDTGSLVHVTVPAGGAYASYDKYLDKTGTLTKQMFYKADGTVYDAVLYNKTGSGTVAHHLTPSAGNYAAYDEYFDASGASQRRIYYRENGTTLDTGGSQALSQASRTLTGSSGADTFTLANLLEPTPTIADFKASEGDTVGIRLSGFGLAAGTKFVDGATLLSGAGVTAKTASPTLLFDTNSHVLSLDADGMGGKAPVALATLPSLSSLSSSHLSLFA